MNSELLSRARSWFRQAESNFRFLALARKSESYDLVCFLSQQVAEEALRAYLVCRGKDRTSTHAITELCQIASECDEGFLQLKNEIEALNYFNIVVADSNPMDHAIPGAFFDRADAEKAIVTAKEVLDFVRDRLSFTTTDGSVSD